MIYSTYILVHPRTQQLQSVLTLEDYHQIQALLEYCLQRQQLQNDFLQQQHRHEHQNREQARLIQALHNNKILQLDYRRQRAAQIQRLMRQHQQQLDQYDRARLLAALEKQRAQQCFQRFIQHHYQPQDSSQREKSLVDRMREKPTNEVPQQQRQAPAQIQVDAVPTIKENDTTQQIEEDGLDQQEAGDEQQVNDAYEQYQTQQLEDLLKHIFEKNTKAQQHAAKEGGEDDDEYAYAPYACQQEAPEDQQTMADLLPILNDTNKDERDVTPPIPEKSMRMQQQEQPQPTTTTNDDDSDAFLPDNVLPLQEVVDDLVRIPTPAVQQQQQEKAPPPPKEATQPPPPMYDENNNKERADKLAKLAVIEQTLDQLSTMNQTDGTTHLPLQYQVNDQGGLVLDGNTPNNHKFLMFEDDIIRCMLQLDQILSEGDPVVRDQRRQLVKKAERLLEPLDQHKQAEWAKETKRQQQQLGEAGSKKKKQRHRQHGKRKVRIPVTA